jgi:diacylglycerol kinase family enzyme
MRAMSVALVLLNPRAAGGRAAALGEPVRTWLTRQAPGAQLLETRSPAEAQTALRDLDQCSRVVAIGGDGTLHHLLDPLLERRHALGLVPFGSGNDSARALGLYPMQWAQALAHALHAPPTPIDCGVLTKNGWRVPFVSSLCAGFDAAICARAIGGPRWLTGMPRYLWHTLRELAALQSWNLRVVVDGELHHVGPALFASTCNTPTFGSGMPAVPDARLDDGRLDLLAAGNFSRAGVLRMLPRLLRGNHLGEPEVGTCTFATLRIESETPIPLAADGEPLGVATAFEIGVRPASLWVVAGPGRAALGGSRRAAATEGTLPDGSVEARSRAPAGLPSASVRGCSGRQADAPTQLRRPHGVHRHSCGLA